MVVEVIVHMASKLVVYMISDLGIIWEIHGYWENLQMKIMKLGSCTVFE